MSDDRDQLFGFPTLDLSAFKSAIKGDPDFLAEIARAENEIKSLFGSIAARVPLGEEMAHFLFQSVLDGVTPEHFRPRSKRRRGRHQTARNALLDQYMVKLIDGGMTHAGAAKAGEILANREVGVKERREKAGTRDTEAMEKRIRRLLGKRRKADK